jgi:hypothetical protein
VKRVRSRQFLISALLGCLCLACAGKVERPTPSQPSAAGVGGRTERGPGGQAAASGVGDQHDDPDAGDEPAQAHDAGRADPGQTAPHDSNDAGVKPTPDAGPIPPAPKAPSVTFEPNGRGFSGSFSLQLKAANDGDAIHYTIDGSVPTASSATYDKPLSIAATTLVRAISLHDKQQSSVVNESYIQLADDAKDFNSNLPVLVVYLQGSAAPVPTSRSYVPAQLAVFEPGSGRTSLNSVASHTSRLGIKIRGRSTRDQAKPSYTVELWGVTDEDAPYAMLGMPSDGDWVLYAPYTFDRAMVRNALMYELSNRIGRYAAHTRFCELFVVANSNQLKAADYVGVYSVTERLTRGPDRIPIQKLHDTDVTEPALTGGYIMQADQPDGDEPYISLGGRQFVYVDPDSDNLVAAQSTYITNYLTSVMSAAAASSGTDTQTGKHYTDLIDSAAFIDHHLLNMLGKNPDAFTLSAYYNKDRNGPLRAGPIWDFDLSIANDQDTWGNRSLDPTHWGPGTSDDMFTRAEYGGLFQQADFKQAYWARWDQLLASTLTKAAFHDLLASYLAQLSEAEMRNRTRWPEAGPRNGDYGAELDTLETWLGQRIDWIVTQHP